MALGGVTIFPSLATRFGSSKKGEKPVCTAAAIEIDEADCCMKMIG